VEDDVAWQPTQAAAHQERPGQAGDQQQNPKPDQKALHIHENPRLT
jgi:hypothetical protein